MQALRKIQKLENNYLKFELPVNFDSSYVEVIILPFPIQSKSLEYQKDIDEDLNDFQKLLLAAPLMSNEDFEYFEEKRKQFNSWK